MNCPNCNSLNIKKNGHTHNRKQNHKCKDCGRQFIKGASHYITEMQKYIVLRLLLERISLRGISRVTKISMNWIMKFSQQLYDQVPRDLGYKMPDYPEDVQYTYLGIEMDELWSFVGKKANKAWIWVAFDPINNQIINFHIGDRSEESLKALWKKIPEKMRGLCDFSTDNLPSYQSTIPEPLHYVGKELTQRIERLFCTVRHRCSRLVRKSLSFSKTIERHWDAFRFFVWHYNLEHQPYD